MSLVVALGINLPSWQLLQLASSSANTVVGLNGVGERAQTTR